MKHLITARLFAMVATFAFLGFAIMPAWMKIL